MSMSRKPKLWAGVTVLVASVAALLVLGWQFLPGNAWGPRGPMIIDPQLATDFSNDRKLVGFWETVFFGKVTSDGVHSDAYPYPTVTYQVEALESLKGTVSGIVQVNQPAHATKEGDPIYFEHAGAPLVNGTTYVFVGTKDQVNGWYVVHSTYQQVAVSTPAGASEEEVLNSDHANELRERFNNAIENEIPFNPASSNDERQEQREKVLEAKDPVTAAPTPTRLVSPVPTGETLVFPRHDEAIPPNRGNQYVYGELSLSGNCLRISYFDQADPGGTRDGLLVVWPAGFDASNSGGMVEVTGVDGSVVAAVGRTLRLSGKKVSRQSAAGDGWSWYGEDVDRCGGPFWLVGDEVTAVGAGATGTPVADDIVFPRLIHQRGPIVSPLAALEGRLTLRGRCLLLETAYSPEEYFVVWPPGFNVHRAGDDLFMLNGGGSVIAKVGDHVTLGGRSGKEGADYSDECPGAYFQAYSVQRAPVDPGG